MREYLTQRRIKERIHEVLCDIIQACDKSSDSRLGYLPPVAVIKKYLPIIAALPHTNYTRYQKRYYKKHKRAYDPARAEYFRKYYQARKEEYKRRAELARNRAQVTKMERGAKAYRDRLDGNGKMPEYRKTGDI